MSSPYSSALNYHLLIFGDAESDVSVLREVFDAHSFRLSVLSDAALVHQAAVQYTPDMILLDVCIPGIDSVAVARQLKKNRFTHHIPVLLLTDMEHIDVCLRGLRDGVDDYIPKPYTAKLVLQRVRARLPATPRQSVALAEHSARGDKAAVTEAQRALVEAVKEYLAPKLTNPPRLVDLIRHFSVSERRLSLAFRLCEGQTVFEYIRQRRMSMAKTLLTESTLSI